MATTKTTTKARPWELIEHKLLAQCWNVEQIQPDGSIRVVAFMGADAEQLAREYLDWKNGKGRAKLFAMSPARLCED